MLGLSAEEIQQLNVGERTKDGEEAGRQRAQPREFDLGKQGESWFQKEGDYLDLMQRTHRVKWMGMILVRFRWNEAAEARLK